MHGFVVDENGLKMSKSIGNVVTPISLVQKHGMEALRLWVASSDYRSDLKIGPHIISSVIEMKKKIRNTLRFMLANVQDLMEIESISSNDPLRIDENCIHDSKSPWAVGQVVERDSCPERACIPNSTISSVCVFCEINNSGKSTCYCFSQISRHK